MKHEICAILGAAGGAVAAAFGGWSAGLTTLVVCMGADYLTGLLAAGVFHASRKTPHGGLESRAGWKGLVRKLVTLVLVLTACRLEALLHVTYIRDAAVIGLCANEVLSVTENAVLMGVPVPRVLAEALELLRQKEDTPSKSLPPSGGKVVAEQPDEGENKSFAEFASTDAKMSNRFLPRRVRGKKHSSGRQCASAASARSGLRTFFVRNPQISDEAPRKGGESHD